MKLSGPSTLLALFVSVVLAYAQLAHAADWALDNDRSELTFISVKAGDIGEVHRFTHIEGQVSATGEVSVAIATASVDTMIAIRDERMRELLFESEIFPNITVTSKVDTAQLDDQSIGEGYVQQIPVTVGFKDRQAEVIAKVVVLRLNPDTVVVSTIEPILLNATSIGFGPGVAKLQEIAGLPSISQVVPVSFILTFSVVPEQAL